MSPFGGVELFLALCHLRRVQMETCIAGDGMDPCLMPPPPGPPPPSAVRDESEAAIRSLRAVLAREPRRVAAVWLLNYASMTLGEWPAKVPAEFRIPSEAFASDDGLGRFPEVASAAGLRIVGRAGGSVLADFNQDGFLDLMVSSWGVRDQLRLFQSNGDGTFREVTESASLIGEVGGLNLVQADYDNDGHADVLVLRGAWLGPVGRMPNSLLRNRADGTFDDVTERAGLLSFRPTQVGAWADYDGDGWLDLFIGNESSAGVPHPSELYRNNRDGTFTDRSADLGDPDLGFVKGAVFGDYNNDGRPDLFVSVQGSENRLLRNDGPRPGKPGEWVFTDVAREAGVLEPGFSFPAWFFDYDNDGWLDLYVAGYGPSVAGAREDASPRQITRGRGECC
jgi:hypothetical protein